MTPDHARWQAVVVQVDYFAGGEPRMWRAEIKARTDDATRRKAQRKWADQTMRLTRISTYLSRAVPR